MIDIKPQRMLVAGTILVGCAIVGKLLFHQFQISRTFVNRSTVKSLYASLDASNVVVASDVNWRVLTDEEYKKAIDSLPRRDEVIDAVPNGWTQEGLLIDTWGNRLHIAVRKQPTGIVDFIVWSCGPDGVSGTSDDIVAPRKKHDVIRSIIVDCSGVVEEGG